MASSTGLSCFSLLPVRSCLQKLCCLAIPRRTELNSNENDAVCESDRLLPTLIIDTDVGFDDLLAVSALKSTKTANIPFISTVGGIQDDPSRAAYFLKHLFPETRQIEIGESSKIVRDSPPEEWLKNCRQALALMMKSSVTQQLLKEEQNCTNGTQSKFVKFFNSHKGNVDLMCLGPLTNVSSWLDSKDAIKLLENRVHNIWIMGGNIPTNKNKTKPEFNFANDPKSVFKMFRNKIIRDKIILVPFQTCSRKTASEAEWDALIKRGKEGNGVISKILQANDSWGSLKYDPLCAFTYANRNISNGAFEIEEIAMSVDGKTGLLLPPSKFSDTFQVKFVTDITVNGSDCSFMAWLGKAIEAENNEFQ